ncbi:MAG: hypothetical protein P9L93_02010 [Candidatus Gorgyraea atricola]|nr:hypothetical protein [Candidatus Gorgyraea atricola]
MKNILFILGAGASKPFGFPLGSELIMNMIKGIEENSYRDIYETFRSYHCEEKIHYDFLQYPYKALFSELQCRRARQLVNQYVEKHGEQINNLDYHIAFADLLNSKTHRSIDYVLNENPSYTFIGRMYIALEILRLYVWPQKTEFDNIFANNMIVPDCKRYQKLSPCYEENWYIYLAEFIKNMGQNVDALNTIYDKNPIKFITFNYDMSLELYLEHCFLGEIYSKFDVGRITSNIFHVYGKADISSHKNTYPSNDTNYLKLVFEQAEKISLLRTSEQTIDVSIQDNVRKCVTEADVICVLGFAFDEMNREAIGLDIAMGNPDKKTYVLNYDNNEYITWVIENLNEHKNINVKANGIKNAFVSGFISPRIAL